jgi:mannose-1-phosphate guanylyltransferase
MVPLGDRPVLGHLLTALEAGGGRLRAVNTHHLQKEISSYIRLYDASVYVSHEEELRGTAGGVWAARAAFEPAPLLVWNADILTQPQIAELVDGLERGPLALSVEVLGPGQGNVGLDAEGRVVRLRKLAIGEEVVGGNYVGIMAMRPDCFEALPSRGCLIGDLAIPLMQRGPGIVGIAHQARWSDLGSLRAYLHENIRWLRDEGTGNNWLAPSADVAPKVELHSCVVGAGATIRGQGLVERVVVWPNATCEAPLSDAIVTPEAGVVPVRAG